MANYGRILEELRLRLIDSAQMDWTDTSTLDNNQWPEALRGVKIDNFGARGFANRYAKHTQDNRAALEKNFATLLE